MKSVARSHFPRVIFEQNQKWLFNPVLRKRFKNRPEERVRLKWVDFLLLQTNWKKTRIGFETPVKLQQKKNALRADLILYSEQMKPDVLIECKSESVSLNAATAEQAARYNTSLQARGMILTNGVEDFCFEINNGKPEKAGFPVNVVEAEIARDASYWSERGFCSVQSDLMAENGISRFLNSFWDDTPDGSVRYLAFSDSFLPIPMDQYYRIFPITDEKKLAVTLIGCESSKTYLAAILNENGINQGILTTDLEKLISGEKKSTRCFIRNSEKIVDAREQLIGFFSDAQNIQINKLSNRLLHLFD
jgi:hypothetical protein